MRTRLPIALAAVALCFGGCMVADQLRDRPGTDPALLQVGAERAAIRAALGEPLRTWKPNEAVDYELHVVRAALKGSKSEAGAIAFLEVISLGMVEGVSAMDKSAFSRDSRQEYQLVWIGFDADARVFGIFSEYAILPEVPD